MYIISNDKNKIDRQLLVDFLLNSSYWAKNRSEEQVLLSIEHSLCFIVEHEDQMVGFARVVSDQGVFAYIADLFILDEHRGKGLGKSLMESILGHEELKLVSRWMLGTLDAHGLYRQYGFEVVAEDWRWMERVVGNELK